MKQAYVLTNGTVVYASAFLEADEAAELNKKLLHADTWWTTANDVNDDQEKWPAYFHMDDGETQFALGNRSSIR